jgi:WD40 repeat protein
MSIVHCALRSSIIGPNSVTYAATFTAVTATILILALPARARQAGQRPSLSVQGERVIRLTEAPQNGRVYDLAFSPKRDSLICALALEQSVQAWDLSAKPHIITTLRPPPSTKQSRGHAVDSQHPLAFSGDGSRLAMGYCPGIQIWDFDQSRILFAVPFLWNPEAVRFSVTDSSLAVGCSWRGFLNVGGGIPPKVEVLPRGEYEGMRVTDPRSLEMDGDLFRRARTGTDPQERRDVYCLAIYPDGKSFVAGGGPVFLDIPHDYSKESSVTIWDIATRRRLFEIGSKELPILRFCLSPNGRSLYTCGDKVLGWDATKSTPPLQKFDTSGRRMISIAVSPDGTMLAAGGLEGTVVIWHINSATRLATLTHNAGPVYGLSFSQASRKLAAAGEGGVATVWDIALLLGGHN